MSATARAVTVRQGLWAEFLGLTYNVIEAGVGLAAGLAAGSVALIGFGLDSVVEASSSIVIIWRLSTERSGASTSEDAERKAIRLVALAFYALALYIVVNSTLELARGTHPEGSVPGIVLAVASLIVMPILARRKRQIAIELSSGAMLADSKQTSLCTYLSAVLLIGLLANSLFGWWWADPLAALGIAFFAAREGHELWHGEDLCC
ncbi:MAG: cation transporter [Actinomycetota bacterium]|nr:cation transporter [Actinomycetota bacterium]